MGKRDRTEKRDSLREFERRIMANAHKNGEGKKRGQ